MARKRRDENENQEVQVDEAGVPLTAESQQQKERQEAVEENVDTRAFNEEDVSVATEQGVKDEVAREEYRKANELEQRRQVSELNAEQEEERVANLTSSVDEEQYAARLQELEDASLDMHRSYNERFEARQKANVMRNVLADMKGEGDVTGETMPESERPKRNALNRIAT